MNRTKAQPVALYRLYDDDGTLLYVGISSSPEARWAQHASGKDWWPSVARKETDWHPRREIAMKAEAAAIRAERPVHNVVHHPERFAEIQANTRAGAVAAALSLPPMTDEAVEAVARIFGAVEQRRINNAATAN